ncbi:MAG: hypothetical protein GX279_04385 [Clostridiaceae bacterium]|jgi:hypothetical protein|nr:hypothetical protein [Clostridiaceae bacterium]
MLIDIIRCIICILAVYGLLGLILGISEMIRCRMTGPRPKVRVVLLVKDAEEQIEYIVRYAIRKEYAAKVLSDKKLVIVDMDSADNTYVLLQKLQKNFPCIEVLKISDSESIFSDF